MIELTDRPIDTQRVLEQVASPAAGAVVLFLGTVREQSGGRTTLAIQYEAYAQMARRESVWPSPSARPIATRPLKPAAG